MQSKCTKHYGKCTGEGFATHGERWIKRGRPCECKVDRNGQLETCGIGTFCDVNTYVTHAQPISPCSAAGGELENILVCIQIAVTHGKAPST